MKSPTNPTQNDKLHCRQCPRDGALAADSYDGFSVLLHQHLARCAISGADDVHAALRLSQELA